MFALYISCAVSSTYPTPSALDTEYKFILLLCTLFGKNANSKGANQPGNDSAQSGQRNWYTLFSKYKNLTSDLHINKTMTRKSVIIYLPLV